MTIFFSSYISFSLFLLYMPYWTWPCTIFKLSTDANISMINTKLDALFSFRFLLSGLMWSSSCSSSVFIFGVWCLSVWINLFWSYWGSCIYMVLLWFLFDRLVGCSFGLSQYFSLSCPQMVQSMFGSTLAFFPNA